MTRGYAKIKEWFYDKKCEEAKNYKVYIDAYSRDERGEIVTDENGYITVLIDEVYKETEKAIEVRLGSGYVVGSVKGWKTWVPKSVISFEK